MTYRITLYAESGTPAETYWPGDEESARRHIVAQVQAGKSASGKLHDESGALIACWPEKDVAAA